MANTVLLKRSGTANSAPTSLSHGELAINYADGKVYWKNSSNTISSFTFASYAAATHSHTMTDLPANVRAASRLHLWSNYR